MEEFKSERVQGHCQISFGSGGMARLGTGERIAVPGEGSGCIFDSNTEAKAKNPVQMWGPGIRGEVCGKD